MSYWGAQVIVNLFAAVPFVGPDLALMIRGDYVVGDATLNRFFSFHVIAVPLVLIGLVAAHILALHEVGSNNPDGVEIKNHKDSRGIPLDGIPFHPYYTVHDIFGVSVFLLIFCAVVFFGPELGGYFLEYNNFIPADSLKTPPHIAPVWYFTPFYSMLRATTDTMTAVLSLIAAAAGIGFYLRSRYSAPIKLGAIGVAFVVVLLLGGFKALFGMVGLTALAKLGLFAGFDAKFWGVVLMGGAVVILFFLPWLDRSPVKSIRYRPSWHSTLYGIFVVAFLILGYLGIQPVSASGTLIAQIGTLYYFGFFLLMPWWTQKGSFKPVPDRVTFAAH
jgi:ubiquinol-cytochrome c reductase cytochrome b subunit